MTGRLEGKVALITGGASGMGLATTRRFLDEGARVVIADLNEETGSSAVTELDAGGRVRFERVDVAAEDDVAGAVAGAVSAYGQLDIVFNNAGVGGAFGAVTELDVEDWDYTFAVLVRGVFLGIKHGARQLIAQGWGGSIINTASIAGMSGGGGPLCYSAAKAAVINLTRAAAIELAPHRIRVNAINPGTILTPLMHGGRPEKVGERLARFVPWPDAVGQPEHIAGAALFLASEDAGYVTGEALVVDGGLTAAGPGLVRNGGPGSAPPGFVGANRGTTGQGTVIRQRPPREQRCHISASRGVRRDVGRRALLLTMAVVAGACGNAVAEPSPPTRTYLQVNLAGGWTDGAEVRGLDDAVAALVADIARLPRQPDAIFLNEACESHPAHLAAALGREWRWFFVPAWPGRSDCFPAPGTTEGRFGNAVLVPDAGATAVVVGSCNDAGVAPARCLPNWAPPAEQRRAICATTASALLCSVHLDPRSWQHHGAQLDALGRIAADLVRERGDVVIGGDLNDGRRRVMAAFGGAGDARFVHLAGSTPLVTSPASSPRRELDHIVYGSTSTVRSAGAMTIDLGFCAATFHDDGGCTDHLAVLAGVID